MQEQSKGIGQVSQAVTQMDEVTQQNAALAKQATVGASSLGSQTRELRTTLSIFQLE
jgi:methyl-accepting chemotaxis protein